MRYDPSDPNADFSAENLDRLIATMSDWSMNRQWTPEQTAAWRLRWFKRTPAQDVAARDEHESNRFDDERYPPEREPFNDWPNGQGVYD